jgi:hypothetical protein
MDFRKLHRKLAPLLFVPLLLTTLTGIAYRIGRSWFGISNSAANFLMTIHQGEFLGTPLVPIYVLLLGLGLLGTIATGLMMIGRKRQTSKLLIKGDLRSVHRILAPIIFLPLTVSATTGIAYRLGKTWFGLSNQGTSILLRIHQGSYLGSFFKLIYVLLVGLGLVAMLITGINMTGIFKKSRQQPKEL